MTAPARSRSFAAAALMLAAVAGGSAAASAANPGDGIRFAKERYLLDGSTQSVCLDF